MVTSNSEEAGDSNRACCQEHNRMSPARARPQTSWSGDERTNHEAIAPPTLFSNISCQIYLTAEGRSDGRLVSSVTARRRAVFQAGPHSSFFKARLLLSMTHTPEEVRAAFYLFFANIATLSAPRFLQKALSVIFAHQNGSCRIFESKVWNVLSLWLLSIKVAQYSF